MLIGGGFGVGLTVAQLCLPSEPGGWNPPETVGRPARLTDLLPVEARTPEEKALELGRVRRTKAALAAYEAALIAALADDRPADEDRRPGEVGAAAEPEGWPPGVSEFFPDELAAILHCSRAEATTVAEHALTLRDRLPATWAAPADGELDWPRARAFAAELGWAARDTAPAVVAAVEAAVLPLAAELSVSRLKAALRRELRPATPSPPTDAARRPNPPPTWSSARWGTGWPSWWSCCRCRWRSPAETPMTDTRGRPRRPAIRGRSVSSGSARSST
ncbi:MAG TPA: DUF222 domain-containing protein [Geodermatophilus sp.]|nr:DUF222 domain-containing protein [Geodermatophilus sp.]